MIKPGASQAPLPPGAGDATLARFDEAAVDAQPAEPARPERWGGFRLVPDTYEFWRHRDDRLHERHLFRARGDGWNVVMLQP